METTAAVLTQINKPLHIEKLTVPALKPGQVLVNIAYSGICHSQLNEIHGLKGEDKFLPHTLGHEGSGIVEAVGEGVTKVKPYDRVILTWIKGAGLDAASTAYKTIDAKLVNSGAISTFLTKAVISENRLVKIPDALALDQAALLGCAIPTGAGIVINTAQVTRGSSVVIFGMGGIGLSALVASVLNAASVIIAVDISDERLQLARSLGATHSINAQKEDVLTGVKSVLTQGADFAFECAGKKGSMESAFRSVRDKGGLCVIAGNLSQGQTIQLDPFDFIRGKRLIGTWGGETQPDRDIPRYAHAILSGKLNVKQLICRIYELQDINEALAFMEHTATGRVLVKLS
ncbi:MAG: zinc-binding dehydrogenase [Candidatus Omnitrophota bacterium]